MMRWAVDITGIDLESDLKREKEKHEYYQQSLRARWIEESATKPEPDPMGKVWTLHEDELQEMREVQAYWSPSAGLMSSGTANRASSPWNGMLSERANSLVQSRSTSLSMAEFEPQPRELRIFCTFLNPQGKRTSSTVTMTAANCHGIDIVNTFLKQNVASDEVLSQRYSTNGRHYRLYIADEFTGEEEMAVQLDLPAQNFSCYAVMPLPAAKLYLFPQRTELLPTTPQDVGLVVVVRPLDPQAKPVSRHCSVPADMLAEALDACITRRLPASDITQGSLRIKYGPLELNINEFYNFGAGCGQLNFPIAELTVLTLYRFGVTEVVVTGRGAEEQSTVLSNPIVEDIEIDMDTDEAVSFQQFEVISINVYGARQQRVLCVDGEHLYTMRPNAEAILNTTERNISDIDEVKLFPNKPKYMEIVYTKTSKFETDHFECTTVYNCALLDEKLRICRRELRKRADEAATAAAQQNEQSSKWFFKGFSRLFRD